MEKSNIPRNVPAGYMVLPWGNELYEVVLATPQPNKDTPYPTEMYGVRNKVTNVFEAYSVRLFEAMKFAIEAKKAVDSLRFEALLPKPGEIKGSKLAQ